MLIARAAVLQAVRSRALLLPVTSRIAQRAVHARALLLCTCNTLQHATHMRHTSTGKLLALYSFLVAEGGGAVHGRGVGRGKQVSS